MQVKPFRIGNMEAKLPLIQGGMGVGISLGGLAGAVAREGGVGIISTAQIGFREADFDENPMAANMRAIRKEWEKAVSIAPEGVVGFNIMVATRSYETYVEAAVKTGANVIISGAGLPMDLPRIAGKAAAKAGKSMPALAPIVSTEKAARVIFRYWDKKYRTVPDFLVVEGPLAGGHLGFTKEQLEIYTTGSEKGETAISPSYEQEIQKIMETTALYGKKYETDIPVVLAGGISDREKAAHAFALGADAVQVASRFVTTEECDADIRYKKAYIRADKEDIVIVKSPVGMPGRAIRNPFMDRVIKGEQIPHSPCHGCLHTCRPAEIPYCITDALVHAAKGEVDEALLFCGADAWKAERIETVREVILSLFEGESGLL